MPKRRDFVGGLSGSILAATSLPPTFLCRAALAAENRSSGAADRVLVVIQLTGGNDGLNTVIPFRSDHYYKARPGIGIARPQVLELGKGHDVGLHPRLLGLKSMFDDGKVGIVQGVGYPHPNRSHFRSMDIWHTADPESERVVDGWLGRALDAMPNRAQRPLPAVSLGSDRLPLAMLSARSATPAIRDLADYRFDAGAEPVASRRRATVKRMLANDSYGDDELEFVRRTAVAAVASAEKLQAVANRNTTSVRYPASALAKNLEAVARAIRGELGTRIFYLSLDGFDTHSKQPNAHAALLGEFSDAVKAFFDDLKSHHLDDRVLLASFSEFGRRVKENASLGTDHGAASQMFLVSGRLRPGIHGAHPRLDDLDDGDLRHHTDFRAVYAALLDDWLGIPSDRVLGRPQRRIVVV